MKRLDFLAFAVLVLLFVSGTVTAADLKSGPQANESLPGPFHPLNVTGENAGKKHCLFCENGDRPVAMIFARDVSPALTKLIKEIDTTTAKNKDEMGSFVVFLSNKEGLDKTLQTTAKQNKITTTVLSIDNPAGPEEYKVAREADVTVVLYVDFTVKANWAFKKGQMKDKDIDAIVARLAQLLPKK